MRKTLTGVTLAMCTLAGTAAQAADFTLRPNGHQTTATGTLYRGVEFVGISGSSGIDRLTNGHFVACRKAGVTSAAQRV